MTDARISGVGVDHVSGDATDALVRMSGGIPASVKDAMRALDRDHGGMAAAARKMTVEPVRDMSRYRR